MAEAERYRFVAIGPDGRRTNGVLDAPGEAEAYETLRGRGLSPVTLRAAGAPSGAASPSGAHLKDREVVDVVGNLGRLLQAGADMRTALNILGARSARRAVQIVCGGLLEDIAGGAALEGAFVRRLGRHGAFVGAMVAAGEASGDLGGGLTRAADSIEGRVRIQSKLISVLAYPAFVLASTVAAVLALLLFVVPSLAPLMQDTQSTPPMTLRLMVAASDALSDNLGRVGLALAGLLAAGLIAARGGLLGRLLDHMRHVGPGGATSRGLTFGGFAQVLGGMLAAGAPMSDALRLSVRSLRSSHARLRLEPVLISVRQGRSLSASLDDVAGFPAAIIRLAAVGEATGALGPMLVRGGALEEEAALTRIERIGQLLGPILIVGLGALVGLLMAGLLSGVSQLGQTALG